MKYAHGPDDFFFDIQADIDGIFENVPIGELDAFIGLDIENFIETGVCKEIMYRLINFSQNDPDAFLFIVLCRENKGANRRAVDQLGISEINEQLIYSFIKRFPCRFY